MTVGNIAVSSEAISLPRCPVLDRGAFMEVCLPMDIRNSPDLEKNAGFHEQK